ncbi:hypothetical protein [Rhodopirellula islandica]|uniref:hypothetical protein n=1 Tax=Rhodopirellula islandica TaxID=595434 RepID=UPI0012371785|nr:hypothetical protein [Rhodopirellula islandica]
MADATKLRSVLGSIVCSVLLAFFAFPPIALGLVMLVHELSLFSTTTGIYDIEINGGAVSNETFIAATLSVGLLLLLGALILVVRAWQNYIHNAGVASSSFREETRCG